MRIRDAADLECGGLTPLWLRRSRFCSVFEPGGEYAALAGQYRRFSYIDPDGDLINLAIESTREGRNRKAQGTMEFIQGPAGDGLQLRLLDVDVRRELFRARVAAPKIGSSDGRAKIESITGPAGVRSSMQLCDDSIDRDCLELGVVAAAVDEILAGR